MSKTFSVYTDLTMSEMHIPNDLNIYWCKIIFRILSKKQHFSTLCCFMFCHAVKKIFFKLTQNSWICLKFTHNVVSQLRKLPWIDKASQKFCSCSFLTREMVDLSTAWWEIFGVESGDNLEVQICWIVQIHCTLGQPLARHCREVVVPMDVIVVDVQLEKTYCCSHLNIHAPYARIPHSFPL